MDLPAIEKISGEHADDPFRVLIGTLLSARTQDQTTHAATTQLFKAAPTPAAVARLSVKRIEKLIYPVGFYRNKARFVKATAEAVEARFGGRVPATLDEMVTLPGVGRKTANLVMIIAFHERRSTSASTRTCTGSAIGWAGSPRAIRRRPRQALYETDRAAMVGRDQPLSRHLGTEHLPAGLSALRRVCHLRRLPADWRRTRRQGRDSSMIEWP